MKVIVAGSRDFNDYDLVETVLNDLIDEIAGVEIVSGKARGADTLGERFAKENGLKIHEFPANWNLYGKRAGFLRNEEMAKFSDALVAFWDGKSPGTKSMIELAYKYKLKVKVIKY